jgi:hypothetical protein
MYISLVVDIFYDNVLFITLMLLFSNNRWLDDRRFERRFERLL